MIISNQEIAIHLHRLRNLSYLTSGKYQLRLSLFDSTAKQQATPVCFIEQL